MIIRREPQYRIWVEGRPQSFQKKRLTHYVQGIREAARQVVPKTTKSPRIDVDIWFRARRSLRADVDNIIKPILDSLKGIVYEDDRQVRSVRVVALPIDDAYRIESAPIEVIDRLHGKPEEFLINIYIGLSVQASRL